MNQAMPEIIQSYADCEKVRDRIADLAGCLEETPEERELIELELVVTIWDTKARQMKVLYPTD